MGGLKSFINIVCAILTLCGSAFAQDKSELYAKKAQLIGYVGQTVLPQLEPALKEAQDSARNKTFTFGAATVTVGAFVLWRYHQSMVALKNQLQRQLQQLNLDRLQHFDELQTASTMQSSASLAQQQSSRAISDNIELGRPFRSAVSVQPHGQLNHLTGQLQGISDDGLKTWWSLLREQGALEHRMSIEGNNVSPAVTRELDELIVKTSDLEERLFSGNQRQIAIEVQKIRAHSEQLQQSLWQAEQALERAQTRAAAHANNVDMHPTQLARQNQFKLNAMRARYMKIGAAAAIGLTGLGFIANVYWINNRYADYFGQNLGHQKIYTSSTRQLKTAAMYHWAKMNIVNSFEDCPESDYAWINTSLDELDRVEHVQTWIDAMHIVCMELTSFDEAACRIQ